MSRTFDIQLKEPAEAVLIRVQQAVTANGGRFQGDTQAGKFSGSGVEGNYEVIGSCIRVSLQKKPWVVTWAYVEEEIRGFFS